MARLGRGSGWEGRQKQHLTGWLGDYGGPGYYGRASGDRTARFVYNHFQCAAGLLWLAEAAGAPRPPLLAAKRAVLTAGPRNAVQSAALRRVFGWEVVEELLTGRRRAPPLQSVLQPTGVAMFMEASGQLHDLLSRLWASPARRRTAHDAVPATEGIYLFTERGRPIYVGQTQDLRRRLGDHTRDGGTHFSASFAFLLARGSAKRAGLNIHRSRSDLASHPRFRPIFREAKRRVALMDVRFLPVKDPVVRTVFEVYAALALGTTRYNSFETH
jgi:hypothetical protein